MSLEFSRKVGPGIYIHLVCEHWEGLKGFRGKKKTGSVAQDQGFRSSGLNLVK